MSAEPRSVTPISTLAHWESTWSDASVPSPIDPSDGQPANHYHRVVHRHLQRWLAGLPPSASLIEVGCGGSRWLPYLSRSFDLEVAGIDYSDAGCAKAAAILEAAGVPGRVVKGDFLSPPDDLVGQFDVAASFGLVEHFDDTSGAVAACARFVKPGGRVVTIVPMLRGLHGLLQRVFNRRLMAIHVPLCARDLADAHRRAGLSEVASVYLLGLPGIIKEQVDASPSVVRSVAWRLSNLYWTLEERRLGVPPNRLTSPYCACFGLKP